MRYLHRILARGPVLLVGVIAASALVVACGNSSSTSGGGGGPTASTKAQVTTMWRTFFAGTTAAATRIKLLENGQQYATQIRALSANPLAKQVKARVVSVKLDSPTRATVKYTILLAGQPVLKNRIGTAVKQNGTWKVGTQSFQQLMQLQQGQMPSGSALPSMPSSP